MMGDREEEVNSSKRTEVGAGLKSISLLLKGRETPISFCLLFSAATAAFSLGTCSKDYFLEGDECAWQDSPFMGCRPVGISLMPL